jgi:nicotinate-nucleotide adenylyltransferase
MRLGIFGGSFDPVHNAHLSIAKACHEQAALDEVWFMPTAIQPFKQRGPHATDTQRVEMLELAIDSKPVEPKGPGCSELTVASRPRPRSSWRVCTLEIDRGGYSYTVDTLCQLHTELPEADLFFMIGADAVRDVPKWKEPAELFQLATLLVARRGGEPDPDFAAIAPLCTPPTQPRLIEIPATNIRSTEIRRRIAAGGPIDNLVPAAVAQYIAGNGLYQ